MSLEETEAASAAVVKIPANRVSLADIEANIISESYRNGLSLLPSTSPPMAEEQTIVDNLSVLTICAIVLRNGFVVLGKAAPADPANFNAELGRKFAREDAIRQIWPLMGYAKREQLARINGDEGDELRALQEQNARLLAFLENPPRHKFWGAGEPDCPPEIKAPNGELHTLRCKVCGKNSPSSEICLPKPPA